MFPIVYMNGCSYRGPVVTQKKEEECDKNL